MPYIYERFADTGKHISHVHAAALCALSEGHPFYTQHLAHALWERTSMGGAVEEGALDAALALLLQREGYAFTTRWEALTRNQQRFLRGLASEPVGTAPFSADFVQRHGLRTPSNAQRAAESLIKLDLIDRGEGAYLITDRFFKQWLQRRVVA